MIPVRNIYYMLAYAFSSLRSRGYASLASEEFDHVDDLLCAILTRGMDLQVRQGLLRSYVGERDSLRTVRGRIELDESIKDGSLYSGRIVCSFDEFSENVYLNRLLKTAGVTLLRSQATKFRKAALKRVLEYFERVDALQPVEIGQKVRFDRQNASYEMLVSVCRLVLEHRLPDTSGSGAKMEAFDEDSMARLYEKFLLGYFRAEHSQHLEVSAPHVPWALDDDRDELLPVMRTDVTLKTREVSPIRILIIDAKYYMSAYQRRYNSTSLHSANLYQILAYVKNCAETDRRFGGDANVSGMLLYAGTDEGPLGQTYSISGSEITVRSLGLDRPFSQIAVDLDEIARDLLV
jgi:5-methylcytosine-specific restriction enzyme subunit McrC